MTQFERLMLRGLGTLIYQLYYLTIIVIRGQRFSEDTANSMMEPQEARIQRWNEDVERCVDIDEA